MNTIRRVEVQNKTLKRHLEEKTSCTKIIDIVLSETIKVSSLIDDLSKVLKLNTDEKFILKAMKLLSILDKLEIRAKTNDEKLDILAIKEKIKKSMELFQESVESLFNLQQRLIIEQEYGSTING